MVPKVGVLWAAMSAALLLLMWAISAALGAIMLLFACHLGVLGAVIVALAAILLRHWSKATRLNWW